MAPTRLPTCAGFVSTVSVPRTNRNEAMRAGSAITLATTATDATASAAPIGAARLVQSSTATATSPGGPSHASAPSPSTPMALPAATPTGIALRQVKPSRSACTNSATVR